MKYSVRPISDRTWLRPAARVRSRFTARWSDTLELLGREIDALGGRDVVFELDVQEKHIRLDGQVRSDARPTDPAVVVAFESKHGPLLYRSDRHSQLAWGTRSTHPWQDNVRAIALTLEALRAVDRYGATETGQQYAGFKALPAGRAMPASHMTRDGALAVLADQVEIPVEHLNLDLLDSIWKTARRKAHPDRNDGDHTVWHRVEEAGRVLGVAR